jgi:hypothetical protein
VKQFIKNNWASGVSLVAIALALTAFFISAHKTDSTVTSATSGVLQPGATATTVKTPLQKQRESTAEYEARTNTCVGKVEFVLGWKVFFTDGFPGNGACTWTSSYPLNSSAFYKSVLDAESCPPGHGVVVGDASNNEGQCR